MGEEQKIAGGLIGLFFMVFVYMLLAIFFIAYPFARIFRRLWVKRHNKKSIKYFLLLILLPYISFWVVMIIYVTGPFKTLAEKISDSFPKMASIISRWQTHINWGMETGIYFDSPYWSIWCLISNPLTQLGFLYFLFQFSRKTGIHYELERYDIKLPKKIKWDKIIKRAFKDAKKEGYNFTFLGYNAFKSPAVITDEERIRQVHIIGSTGSGKTESLILPMIEQDMARGRGIVFIDAKGDLTVAKTLYKMAKNLGREKDFLMFSSNNPEKSNTYNPLLLGNSTQLKDKIIGTMHFTEPYYKRECENGLQILFSEYLAKHNKITLSDLNEILKYPPKDMPEFRDFFDGHKKNITGLQSEINLMVKSPFGALFNGEEINLLDVYQQKKIAYFTINVLTYAEMGHRLGRFITGDVNTVAGLIQDMDAQKRQELAVYIDEYGYFGTPKFAYTLSQGRSAGFMITMAHQNIDDLKGISPEHPGQVRTNTNTKIILKVNDPTTAEEFANELGTYRTIEETRQWGGETEKGTEKVVDAYKVHPQQIKELKVGQGFYKTPSEWGFLVLRHFKRDIEGISIPNIERPKKTQLKEPEKSFKGPSEGPSKSIFGN